MKPIEDYALEDAKSADLVLAASPDDTRKAKCRLSMQGLSEPDLLVHRDLVAFTTQALAAKQWQPGYEDFTQAFHSADAIGRELYCTQPPEGIPGTSSAWYSRITKFPTHEF